MASRNFKGATVNGSGTKIAASVAFGTTGKDTSKESNDSATIIKHGSMEVDVKSAISMGILNRNSSGTLEELNPAQPYTRQG